MQKSLLEVIISFQPIFEAEEIFFSKASIFCNSRRYNVLVKNFFVAVRFVRVKHQKFFWKEDGTKERSFFHRVIRRNAMYMRIVERGIHIWAILLKKSSIQHPLSYSEIQKILRDTYGEEMHYTTVKNAVNELSLVVGIAEDDQGRVFIVQ